ncbi:hypothetical protein AF332_20770 [Sporosarcina globispora]|uniref:Uncharacterized protein n=1 Tax=Sporosarcina globispora TaxID=1459 RepID=A0A0M0GHS5_SPOGL|nr:hypothetical protein [Sporosarcina globispora]KON88981.1 hypothetical protein AF332_20770 [Sporosarcina globispora]
MNTKTLNEYTDLRKTTEYKRFLFWLDKIVAAEKDVQNASMKLTSNLSAEELNSLQLGGNRIFQVNGESVENYQKVVADYCKVHEKLFSKLERLEQKYPAIFLSKDGLERKMGLIQQKALYLKVVGEFTPTYQEDIQ